VTEVACPRSTAVVDNLKRGAYSAESLEKLRSKLEGARARASRWRQHGRELQKLLAGRATLYVSPRVKGARACVNHCPESVRLIQDVVRFFRPHLIVEFGTKYGGLTLVLHDACPEATLYSYDLHKEYLLVRLEWFGPSVYFVTQDLLAHRSRELKHLLCSAACKLLYCDNGDKEREVLMYAPLLNSGDLLGVHDWEREVRPEKVQSVLVDFDPVDHQLFAAARSSTRFWRRR